jgi:hypothetical protein
MIRISVLFALISYFTNKLLQSLSTRWLNPTVRIGRADVSLESSLMHQDEEKKARIATMERQKRAMQDFFRDTGGKISDIRVLKSAMYLSDEIDRAVKGLDQENQHVGWRQYNRFYSEGTEDLFTNVPSGRSPLVLAAPKTPKGTNFMPIQDNVPLPIEYQSNRRSHLKQIGRTLDETVKLETNRLTGSAPVEEMDQLNLKSYYVPTVQIQEVGSSGGVAMTLPFQQQSVKSQKEAILKFEGEITDRRPDL